MRITARYGRRILAVFTAPWLVWSCRSAIEGDPPLDRPKPFQDGGRGGKGLPPTGTTESSEPVPPPKPTEPHDPGVFLVNAVPGVAAFRVCKSDAPGAGFSTSPARPVPTTLMPRSNIAGVAPLGAVRIDPQREIGADSEVVVLTIDDVSKSNEGLKVGPCRAVACTSSGGSCLGSLRLRRAPIVDKASRAPFPNAFVTPGAILVLRDDGAGGVRFEVETAQAPPPGRVGDLDVDLHNLSKIAGSALYANAERSDGPASQASRGATSFPLPRDYTQAKIAYGTHAESLALVHDNSDPRVPLDRFFKAPGAYLVLLVGDPASDAAPSGLRFVALPMNGFPPDEEPQDAGSD